MSHAGVGSAVEPLPLSQSTSAGGNGPLGISGKDLDGPGTAGCEREVVGWNGWEILGQGHSKAEAEAVQGAGAARKSRGG